MQNRSSLDMCDVLWRAATYMAACVCCRVLHACRVPCQISCKQRLPGDQ
jgi:hypothetical protein